LSDLQYKQIRLPWKTKLLRVFFWFSVSIAIAFVYATIFEKSFGSPKEKLLTQQIDNMKLQYSLIGMEMDNSLEILGSLRLSDDRRYRPILDMDSVPDSYRKAGYGGVDRYRDLTGYSNSALLIKFRTRNEELKNMAKVQNESFKTIAEQSIEWKREIDHFPGISPVSVVYRLGDKFAFRQVHPVFGIARWHYGQDFEVPYGTNVYVTGDGTVIESGYSTGGFGNVVVVDHGYGIQTTYGHLSEIRVPKGLNVKRGDIIGLSGSTGASTGPHLHYQIDKFGEHVNPINFFNNDVSDQEYQEMIQEFSSRSKFR
jgi:murein DD-endopeptidase MepM/ murein hydrolase activator NlpD